MFPSIPTNKALLLIREKLTRHKEDLAIVSPLTPDEVIKFLSLSLEGCFAVVEEGEQSRFFRQKSGLAMGKSFSPVVADIFMGAWEECLEEKARASGGDLKFAMRYADDYLCGFKGSEDALQAWLRELNQQEPSIQVELERERNKEIAFLDIKVKRTPTGIKTAVYRKACFTGQVIPFHSFTQLRHKQAGLRAEFLRAQRYCNGRKEREQEFAFVKSLYTRAGYPQAVINKARAQATTRRTPMEEEEGTFVSIPYTGKTFHELKREARKIGITLVAKSGDTLGARLTSRHKHRLPPEQESGVIYGIRCGCGAAYVGETSQELQDRVKQHKAAHRTSKETSAFGVQPHPSHSPAFEESVVLAREKHQRLRLLKEAAFIKAIGQGEDVLEAPGDRDLNRNGGCQLAPCWAPALAAYLPSHLPQRREDDPVV
jgi:predicted GIY-YIG superfamily endonuclease